MRTTLLLASAMALLAASAAATGYAQQEEHQQPQQQTQPQQQQQAEQQPQQPQQRQQATQPQDQQRQDQQRQQQQAQQQRTQLDDEETQYTGQERAALGVQLGESERGVRVTRIVPDSPAEHSGLQQGDHILRIDDQQVQSYRDVIRTINRKQPDDRLTLTIQRDGQEQQIEVELGQRRDVFEDEQRQFAEQRDQQYQAPRDQDRRFRSDRGQDAWQEQRQLGARQPDRQQRGQLMLGISVQPAERGVWVTNVYPDGPADAAGLREGDLILALDGQQIRSSRDIVEQLRDYSSGDRVRLDVQREQQRGQITARLRERQQITAGPAAAERDDDRQDFQRQTPQRDRFEQQDQQRRQQPQRQEQYDDAQNDNDQPAIGVSLSRQQGEQGVVIEDVYEGSPADRIGLRSGDEILAIEGRPVRSPEQLKREVTRHEPHQQVELIVLRDGRQRVLDVTLARRADLEEEQQGDQRGDDRYRDQRARPQDDRQQEQDGEI